jgi:hypothetical protein
VKTVLEVRMICGLSEEQTLLVEERNERNLREGGELHLMLLS